MATITTPRPIARLRGSTGATCDEGLAAAQRIHVAALHGSLHAVVNEAGRLHHRLTRCRAEVIRLTGGRAA